MDGNLEGRVGEAPGAPPGQGRARGGADQGMAERVERIISLNHPYRGRDRLLSVLPGRVSRECLDRILAHLEASKKIAIDGETVHWISTPARPATARGNGGEAEQAPILAGTRFETIEEGRRPTETTGEYIARILNDDEAGSCTAEDAAEIDEDMRRLARGEYYSHEQVWKEFGL